jgi:hypothetical protein
MSPNGINQIVLEDVHDDGDSAMEVRNGTSPSRAIIGMRVDTDTLQTYAGSETASLASSILKYREENGRRYHAYKAGAYFLPNDDVRAISSPSPGESISHVCKGCKADTQVSVSHSARINAWVGDMEP